jgi:hypothetical protein
VSKLTREIDMQCSFCNSDLEASSEIDTSNISSDCITENFKCTNEDECGKNFEIEFHPVNMIALD